MKLELLSEVLGYEVIDYNGVHHNFIEDGVTHTYYPLNKYELAHKISEWAFENGYFIESNHYGINLSQGGQINGSCEAIMNRGWYCVSSPVPTLDAHIRVGEWILEQLQEA